MRNFVHRYHPAIKRVHGLNLNCLDANKFTYSDLPPQAAIFRKGNHGPVHANSADGQPAVPLGRARRGCGGEPESQSGLVG